MGNLTSKTEDPPKVEFDAKSPNIKFMKDRYGEESLNHLGIWINNHGIPDKGSFSTLQYN